MSKVYTLEENLGLLNRVIDENEEFHWLKDYNVRFAIVYVLNTTKDGETIPAFQSLPYRVKVNSAKDRCIKHIDVEIHIDESYFNEADDEEKEAVIFGALSQLEVKCKDGMPILQDDGVVKLVLKKPDMVFEGFSVCASKYRTKSPEHKAFTQLTVEFNDILF